MKTSDRAMDLPPELRMLPHDPHETVSGGRAVSTQPAPAMSREEYLEFERGCETKHEYYDGQVFEMPVASLKHNMIVGNLIYRIRSRLEGTPVRVFPSDLRVHITDTGLYTYPDVIIVCGTPQLEDEHQDTLLNPDVVFEVLSPSTERYDRGRKAEHYRTIASLKEYLLVKQDHPRIERYQRSGAREWVLTEAIGLDESIELASVRCVLPLLEVYENVF
jgi:Uma2 family endonuclease